MTKRLANGKLSSAQKQLRALQGEIAQLAQPGRSAQDLEDLQVQLAELDVAYEELEQQNDELQTTLQNATSAADKYGGFVVSTSVTDDEDNPTGSIVVIGRPPGSR